MLWVPTYHFAYKYKTFEGTPGSVNEDLHDASSGRAIFDSCRSKKRGKMNSAGAIDDVNILRIRAGLIPLDQNLTGQQQ